jgi:alkanesulfonate monooxygenase
MKIMPGCFVVVGETTEEAREKRARLDSLVHYAMDRDAMALS